MSGNTATCSSGSSASGAGIYATSYAEASLTITNSAIYGNVASGAYGANGGGIYASGVTTTLTNATVAGNAAVSASSPNSVKGGGIYSTGKPLNLYNTIVADNTAKSGSDLYSTSNSTVSAFNVLSSYTEWSEGSSFFEYDPDAPLFKDPEAGDYSLARGSQAIDLGNNEYAIAAGLDGDSYDIVGEPRFCGLSVDLGAYESIGFVVSQSDVFSGDVLISWTEYKGAVSARLSWTTATTAAELTLGGAEGSFTWDTTQFDDRPGVLALEYLDSEGEIVKSERLPAYILNAGNIVVNTLDGNVNEMDAKISLVEAITYAETYRITAPILFASNLKGSTVVIPGTLSASNVTVDGESLGVTVKTDSLEITEGRSSSCRVTLRNVTVETSNISVDGKLSLLDAAINFAGESEGVLWSFAKHLVRGQTRPSRPPD